jgi:hypothetical protein
VFKIQANMDPMHRDRVAFLRVCSGKFEAGMKAFHVRSGKEQKLANALTFMASDREHVETAYPGDVIGLHNHGTISIGDSFTAGEKLRFTGIPNFAPELFRRARLRDPLKLKQLQKGLAQLSEEGATQFFRPMMSNDLISARSAPLQFDVVAYRLKDEYSVDATFEPVTVATARWVRGPAKKLEEFREKAAMNLAIDAGRRAGLPGADAGEPAADRRALAGPEVRRHARACARGGAGLGQRSCAGRRRPARVDLVAPEVVAANFARQPAMALIGRHAHRDLPGRGRSVLPVPHRAHAAGRLHPRRHHLHRRRQRLRLCRAVSHAAGSDVLSVEFKLNMLRPAAGERFVARAQVLKRGKTLTAVRADVFALMGVQERLIAAMQATMIRR